MGFEEHYHRKIYSPGSDTCSRQYNAILRDLRKKQKPKNTESGTDLKINLVPQSRNKLRKPMNTPGSPQTLYVADASSTSLTFPIWTNTEARRIKARLASPYAGGWAVGVCLIQRGHTLLKTKHTVCTVCTQSRQKKRDNQQGTGCNYNSTPSKCNSGSSLHKKKEHPLQANRTVFWSVMMVPLEHCNQWHWPFCPIYLSLCVGKMLMRGHGQCLGSVKVFPLKLDSENLRFSDAWIQLIVAMHFNRFSMLIKKQGRVCYQYMSSGSMSYVCMSVLYNVERNTWKYMQEGGGYSYKVGSGSFILLWDWLLVSDFCPHTATMSYTFKNYTNICRRRRGIFLQSG